MCVNLKNLIFGLYSGDSPRLLKLPEKPSFALLANKLDISKAAVGFIIDLVFGFNSLVNCCGSSWT
jgi:hypothetical protein